jgi:uncharacterized protein (DUF1501 family)
MGATRRDLLIGGVQLAALWPLGALGRAQPARLGAPRSSGGRPRCLVVVQLTGANDGLNTLVPFRQDEYFRLRPTLALPPRELTKLDEDHGLHPALAPLREPFERGQLAVVRGVGLPAPNRSHFAAMEAWHTGQLGPATRGSGWLGRMAERIEAASTEGLRDVLALHVGGGDLPLSLRGERSVAPSVEDPAGFQVAQGAAHLARVRDAWLAGAGGGGELGFLRDAARASFRAAERMAALASQPSKVDYPGSALARHLRLVARLISGGFGARIFQTEHSGYDTHSRQANVQRQLLEELATALAAFQRDLEANGVAHDVMTMVFSEFGRRAEENGSRGTDHGAGGPLFLLGAGVAAGWHGRTADLARDLVDGDVPSTTDFRAVYACLERDWMGLATKSQEVGRLNLVQGE